MINPHRSDRIILSRAEFYRLKRAQAMLQALESGGVDNWEWHHEAYKEYMKEAKGQPWSDIPADEYEDEDDG